MDVQLNRFMFATGIENSYPTIQLPDGSKKRVDEMEKTLHYKCWRQDFELVKYMGIKYLRYGPPYYKTHTGPGQYDWAFTDETFNCLKELDIIPLVDLCHFGVPDWIGDFQNPDWPYNFAEYASAFAKRFPYLKYYTPVNEIYITATFSAQFGWWNERQCSDRTFITAIRNLCKANMLAMQEILKIQPQATFIQSESTEYFHADSPETSQLAEFFNERRFIPLDLTYGYPISLTCYRYLMENGMTLEEYDWYRNNQIRKHCVMGNDYYATNEHVITTEGNFEHSGELLGYYVITSQYYHRYKLPIMHTETNAKEPYAVEWLKRQWANVHRLKQDGVPIIGFTWYSLIDQVDWDSALTKDDGKINALGLFDIDRKIRPVGEKYKQIIQDWKDVIAYENFGLIINH
jgi:beta-glucosidase/6-phospho-beta-glucosidase/beta-galactosidase